MFLYGVRYEVRGGVAKILMPLRIYCRMIYLMSYAGAERQGRYGMVLQNERSGELGHAYASSVGSFIYILPFLLAI